LHHAIDSVRQRWIKSQASRFYPQDPQGCFAFRTYDAGFLHVRQILNPSKFWLQIENVDFTKNGRLRDRTEKPGVPIAETNSGNFASGQAASGRGLVRKGPARPWEGKPQKILKPRLILQNSAQTAQVS
jgi:hypothetical protein